ncbi:hypothetical protein Y1Q_0021440 [Alligator mississippiensis]|uniref:Uncharacterized protein n=1 Tax=Alligator mississippiensis TaxID=8496 RepID=A0A151P9X1_ALLMI|nr:hypothetical protein Y1Q_0021440 [Alligator mississippiensis]
MAIKESEPTMNEKESEPPMNEKVIRILDLATGYLMNCRQYNCILQGIVSRQISSTSKVIPACLQPSSPLRTSPHLQLAKNAGHVMAMVD